MKDKDQNWIVANLAFKTIKLLSNKDSNTYEISPKREFKWQHSLFNKNKILNQNIKKMWLNIISVEQLHRYDSMVENLGFDNLKPLYICATLKDRLYLYNGSKEYMKDIYSKKCDKKMMFKD